MRSVRRNKGVRYPLVLSTELPATPIGGQKSNADGQGMVNGQPAVFDAPLITAGKTNRVVWTHLQKVRDFSTRLLFHGVLFHGGRV